MLGPYVLLKASPGRPVPRNSEPRVAAHISKVNEKETSKPNLTLTLNSNAIAFYFCLLSFSSLFLSLFLYYLRQLPLQSP